MIFPNVETFNDIEFTYAPGFAPVLLAPQRNHAVQALVVLPVVSEAWLLVGICYDLLGIAGTATNNLPPCYPLWNPQGEVDYVVWPDQSLARFVHIEAAVKFYLAAKNDVPLTWHSHALRCIWGFLKICPVETNHIEKYMGFSRVAASSTCELRLVRTSHGLHKARELGSQGCQLGWFHCSESHWHSGFEPCLKLAEIIRNPWFIGRICLKHCKQTMIFWCLELMVMVLLNILEEITTNAHSSIADGSSAQLSREKTNSDLVSVASLCFF